MQIQSIPVFIVDDEPDIRESLRSILAAAGYLVQAFDGVDKFWAATGNVPTFCLIVDLLMPGITGLQLCQELVDRETPCTFLVVTASNDIPSVVAAMKLGAIDLLEKPFRLHELLNATGRAVQSARSKYETFVEIESCLKLLAQLSPREQEILDAVSEGLPTKSIAKHFGISTRTVDVHRSRIMTKLNIESPRQLATLFDQLRNSPGKSEQLKTTIEHQNRLHLRNDGADTPSAHLFGIRGRRQIVSRTSD